MSALINHRDTKAPRDEDEVARAVVNAAFKVHSALGPGLLEGIYEACLAHELHRQGLSFEKQLPIPIEYEGLKLATGLRLDLVVENRVVVELKAVETLLSLHKAQLLSYLKLSGRRLGLLINFNVPLIKDGIKRMVL